MTSSVWRKIGGWSIRFPAILAAVAAISLIDYRIGHFNATAAGFTYIVAVLLVAAFVGAAEAIIGSIAAAVCFNYFFLPPILTFTVADPQNWVALFALLITAVVASRLAARAREQTREALDRQQEMELLYSISRAILLSDPGDSMARRITYDLVRIFEFSLVILFDARTAETYRAGSGDFSPLNADIENRLREAAVNGASYVDPDGGLHILAVRLGGQPIGSLAVSPARVSETALQSVTNLVAITLEKVRSQEEANRIEAERRSETLRSTMLDAIAHEFKTPLTSIKAAASMLASHPSALPGRIQELGSIVEEEADRMERLVTEAIQMARIEGGKVKMDRRAFNPTEIVESAIGKNRSELEGHTVSISAPEPVDAISGDADLIELALRNLLGNAAKFSSSGSPIEVHISNSKGGVLIEVRDSGPGIPESEQSHIFEKFYRAPQTSGTVSGSGIGLNIVREIVCAHGGRVWVESQPGEGARFSMVLPAAAHPLHESSVVEKAL